MWSVWGGGRCDSSSHLQKPGNTWGFTHLLGDLEQAWEMLHSGEPLDFQCVSLTLLLISPRAFHGYCTADLEMVVDYVGRGIGGLHVT